MSTWQKRFHDNPQNARCKWGVELGKQLASTILKEIVNKKGGAHDSSTSNLLRVYNR